MAKHVIELCLYEAYLKVRIDIHSASGNYKLVSLFSDMAQAQVCQSNQFFKESIVDTGAMLRSFSWPALLTRGISIRILQ